MRRLLTLIVFTAACLGAAESAIAASHFGRMAFLHHQSPSTSRSYHAPIVPTTIAYGSPVMTRRGMRTQSSTPSSQFGRMAVVQGRAVSSHLGDSN